REEKPVQRQQRITGSARKAPVPAGKQEAGLSPFARRSGVVSVRGTLNRSQCLLDLALELTHASRVGVALVSADGQFAHHLPTGDPAERAEVDTAWLVALTEWAHHSADRDRVATGQEREKG